MPAFKILVVDDEPGQNQALAGFLKKKGYETMTANSGREALEIVQNKQVDLVLTDLRMPDMDGAMVLSQTKDINPGIEVLIMTAFGSIEGATRAMKNGAVDFITKPIDLEQLELTIAKIFTHRQLVIENRQLKELVNERFQFGGILSKSQAMQPALSIAARVAESKATVLITGESGTGKELIAKAIHFAGNRAHKPFIAVNMAALPETLLESELFGHEKGAFTGADKFRKGRFEMAHEGTLFIDEIGDLPSGIQVKLLRVLQEQQIERLGSSESIPVDVRIITATHKPLEEMVKSGVFRQDLFYRLNVVKITLPPLRERKADIPLLTGHFIERYAKINNKNISGISNEGMDRLVKYHFPGNVRELENIIEQAVVLCRDNIIGLNDLPTFITQPDYSNIINTGSFQERVSAFEKTLILEALQKSNGVQTRAAESLGMTERHLRYKLKKYNIKNE
ncbi:MAG TPA: sigma-54 dependent transcriptional regulator [bacterium]|nr:sigma-54 dependent transcriptional regulator [bacterium]HPN42593.1 sigma-54 dependent transcriptional regulator [bacterium]